MGDAILYNRLKFALLIWIAQVAICPDETGMSFSNHHKIAPNPALEIARSIMSKGGRPESG